MPRLLLSVLTFALASIGTASAQDRDIGGYKSWTEFFTNQTFLNYVPGDNHGKFRISFSPDGTMTGVQLNNGQTFSGSWKVDESQGQLCTQWTGGNAGCTIITLKTNNTFVSSDTVEWTIVASDQQPNTKDKPESTAESGALDVKAVRSAARKRLVLGNADHTKLHETAIAGGYALQVWSGDNMGGQALLKYDPTDNRWIVLTGGGGASDVSTLVGQGVPQDTAQTLIAKLKTFRSEAGDVAPQTDLPLSVMKQCGNKWQAAKAAGTTGDVTWKQFLDECQSGINQAKTAPTPAATASDQKLATAAASTTDAAVAGSNNYTDPFAFCKDVKDADDPISKGYKGPNPPTIDDAFAYWRCMDGLVYGCHSGQSNMSLLICGKVIPAVTTPTKIIKEYCAQHPGSVVPKAANDTTQGWICRGTVADIDKNYPPQTPRPDKRGYDSSEWTKITALAQLTASRAPTTAALTNAGQAQDTANYASMLVKQPSSQCSYADMYYHQKIDMFANVKQEFSAQMLDERTTVGMLRWLARLAPAGCGDGKITIQIGMPYIDDGVLSADSANGVDWQINFGNVRKVLEERQARQAQIAAQNFQIATQKRIATEAAQALQNKVSSDIGYSQFVLMRDYAANPFRFNGIIGLQTTFVKMLSADEALFADMNNVELHVSGVPPTMFSGNEDVILGIRAAGTKGIKTANGEVSLPSGAYAGAYKCVHAGCTEFFVH